MCLYVSMCVHVYSRRLPSSSAGVYMCLYVSMKARAQDILQRLLFSFSMSHHHTYNVTSSYAQDILQRLLCSFFSFFSCFFLSASATMKARTEDVLQRRTASISGRTASISGSTAATPLHARAPTDARSSSSGLGQVLISHSEMCFLPYITC